MRVHHLLRELRRRLLLHRRLLAALAAAAAVALGLQAARPAAPATVAVWVAADDLAGGAVLHRADLRTVALPAGDVPAHAPPARTLIGRALVAPVRAGQQLSDLSVVGRAVGARYPGRDVVPVRLGDAGAAALLHAGDRVDVVAGDPRGDGSGRLLSRGAQVVTVPSVSQTPATGEEPTGRLVLLAVAEDDAVAVTAAGLGGYLGVVWTD
ncbi:CpaB family protein [Nocardioides mangrovicus]|uniref:pilus assembly protein CpaB n=1 Tax=Nocardioides mangrovicus TaxID=2478913 RepID=UPI000EF78DB6|nr:pilus assembly protein CpaB [Nocardioides mangrovicus]